MYMSGKLSAKRNTKAICCVTKNGRRNVDRMDMGLVCLHYRHLPSPAADKIKIVREKCRIKDRAHIHSTGAKEGLRT